MNTSQPLSSLAYFDVMGKEGVYEPHPVVWQWKKLLIARYACGVVLDVGCANGVYLPFMRQYSRTVIGIDNSPWMIRAAMLREHGVLGKTLYEMSVLDLPDSWDQRFSTIFCLGTFYYIKEQEEALAKMIRALAPNGILLLEVRIKPGTGHVEEHFASPEWYKGLFLKHGLEVLETRDPPKIGILNKLRPKQKLLFITRKTVKR